MRRALLAALFLAPLLLVLAACSSSGAGPAPARTYLIEPNGQAVQVANPPPGTSSEGGTSP